MRHDFKRTQIVLLTCALILVAQLIVMPIAHAVDAVTPQGTPSDLSVAIIPLAKDRLFGVEICNHGTDTIIDLTLDIEIINLEIDYAHVPPDGFTNSIAIDSGSFDITTSQWVGEMGPVALDENDAPITQCVIIAIAGPVTGALGEEIEITATILSSTLGDSTPNIDPDSSNDTYTHTSVPIVLDPDLTLETRLVTTGAITNGTPVSYEVTISNTGAGDYLLDGGQPLGIYFIVPSGTTYDDITDPDLTDNLAVDPDPQYCGSLGAATNLPALSSYDVTMVGCRFASQSGILPPGSSYKVIFNMIASGPFSTGDTQSLAILAGDDIDSSFAIIALMTPGSGQFPQINDNVSILDYDSVELTAIINPCIGTSTVVTVDDACFTVTFNKQIYEPSFTVDDLALTGQGSIYSFSKSGVNQWTVRINGMKAGDTLTLSLANESVQDYSAVLNGTQVLGINTVKFEVPGSASGTLAATGVSNYQLQLFFALSLLSMGYALLLVNKRRMSTTI